MKFKDFRNIVKVNRFKCSKCKKSYLKLRTCLSSNLLFSSSSNRLARIRILNNSNTLISLIISLNTISTILDKFLKVKNSSKTLNKIKTKFKELKTQLILD